MAWNRCTFTVSSVVTRMTLVLSPTVSLWFEPRPYWYRAWVRFRFVIFPVAEPPSRCTVLSDSVSLLAVVLWSQRSASSGGASGSPSASLR